LLGGKAFFQMITTLPDPYGIQQACWKPEYGEWGSWIFTRLEFEYCGDCIYSGHFYHLMLSVVMIDKGFIETGQYSPCPTRLTFKRFQIIYWTIGCIWAMLLLLSLVFVRFHYTVDILLALIITVLVTTHKKLLDIGVKFLNPNYQPKLTKIPEAVIVSTPHSSISNDMQAIGRPSLSSVLNDTEDQDVKQDSSITKE